MAAEGRRRPGDDVFPILRPKIRPPQIQGFERGRLLNRLEDLWRHRFGLVVAPAGWGKTTLLSQFTGSLDVPVAWYRAEERDSEGSRLLTYLHAALREALGSMVREWRSLEAAIATLEAWKGPRALLVVDDLQVLHGAPSEALLERFIEYAPAWLTILVASRLPPSFNLPSLRVAERLLELGADDLRFRLWEAEGLFRHHYRQPLGPEELADLTQRTGGWAAGLQLFHLATATKTRRERQHTLEALAEQPKLLRDYLARNIVDGLPARLRSFMVETCVLGTLNARICERLLGSPGAAPLIDEIASRQLLVLDPSGSSWYRYQPALLLHLEATLLEELGEEETRRRYRAAAVLLEEAGALPDAICAYCRADDWKAALALLGQEGNRIAAHGGLWLEVLPKVLGEQDPWLLLARARRARAAGRWEAAIRYLREAERAFGGSSASGICLDERLAINTWLDGSLPSPPGWHGTVRAATKSHPLAVLEPAKSSPWPRGRLAAGLVALIAGRLHEASALLAEAAEADDASPTLRLGARIARAAATLLSGETRGASELEASAEEAEALGVPWLGRMTQALLALSERGNGQVGAAWARLTSRLEGDPWGGSLAGLIEGLGALRQGKDRPDVLEEAAAGFRELGADSLEAWCVATQALGLARAGRPDAAAAARRAQAISRSRGIPGALAIALFADSLAGEAEEDSGRLAKAIAEECGIDLRGLVDPHPAIPDRDGHDVLPPISVRCFGGFELQMAGRPLMASELKSKVRDLLKLLALRAGEWIHREILMEALWPELGPQIGVRNLQVAIHALRHALEPDVKGKQSSLIPREGEAYRLRLPPCSSYDVGEFRADLARARALQSAGRAPEAIVELDRALGLYRGELLPEVGPADWVVWERERCRQEAAEAALNLAGLLVDRGALGAAVEACERGIGIDPHQDGLWRRLVRAHEGAGHYAAAAAARRKYGELLSGLGISAPPS